MNLHSLLRRAVDSLQWSSPLQVLQYPHPQLRAVNARLSPAAFGPELRKLADEMFDIMYRCVSRDGGPPLSASPQPHARAAKHTCTAAAEP